MRFGCWSDCARAHQLVMPIALCTSKVYIDRFHAPSSTLCGCNLSNSEHCLRTAHLSGQTNVLHFLVLIVDCIDSWLFRKLGKFSLFNHCAVWSILQSGICNYAPLHPGHDWQWSRDPTAGGACCQCGLLCTSKHHVSKSSSEELKAAY